MARSRVFIQLRSMPVDYAKSSIKIVTCGNMDITYLKRTSCDGTSWTLGRLMGSMGLISATGICCCLDFFRIEKYITGV